MLNFKKIVCPTDFSEASYEAVKMANDMALHFKAELFLVHVVVPIAPIPDSLTVLASNVVLDEARLCKEMEARLQQLLGVLISKDVVVRTETLYGDPADKIVSFAESENVDLIVIATHGMTGWRHYIQGSVALKVIQQTRRPLFLIQGKTEDE